MNLGPISTGTKNRDIKVAIYIENSNDTEVLSWMYCHWSIFSRMTNINTCNCWNEHKPHQESSVHHLYNVISDSLGLLGSHRNQSLTFLIHEKCKILWARCGGSRDLLLKFRDKLGFELRSEVPLQAGKYQVWSHCGGGWKAGPQPRGSGKHKDVAVWAHLPPCLVTGFWMLYVCFPCIPGITISPLHHTCL